jgi:hypothetical protein
MGEIHWTIRPPRQQPADSSGAPVDVKARERLRRAVEAKVAEGFQIESRADRYAVMVKPPRPLLGITLPGRTTRITILLDNHGHPAVRPS